MTKSEILLLNTAGFFLENVLAVIVEHGFVLLHRKVDTFSI